VGRVKVSDINKLRQELLKQYETDPLKKAYVERYISFLKIDAKCDTDIRQEGTMIWIENGSQRFAKTNPSVNTKLEIAKKLERLEHLIGIATEPEAPQPSTENNTKKRKSSLI
jgi:DNA-binding XRE family transcriptional regulator